LTKNKFRFIKVAMNLIKGLTTAEAAVKLGKTVRHVQWLITEGKLPAERVGRDYFIREEDLELVKGLKRGRPKKPITKAA
jgi:excisionase family DNA binding protein